MLIAAVVLALVALGFVLGRTMVSRRQAEEVAGTANLDPDVSQRITDFRRVKVKDGRRVWELTAAEAEYLEDRGQVVVTRPEVAFYGADGQRVVVKGAEGRVFVNGTEIDKIELGGGIEVEVGGYVVTTREAIYIQANNLIASQGDVRIAGKDLLLEGHGIVVDLGTQRVHVVNGVKTTLRGAAEVPGAAAPERAASEGPQARRADGGGGGVARG